MRALSTESPLRRAAPYAGIFLLAWALRLVYLLQVSGHPSFHFPLVDAREYHELALRLAGGASDLPKMAWQPWFYPMLLAQVYQSFGASIWAAKLLQITAGSLTCVVAALMGTSVGSRRTGILAGVLAAVYGPMIYYDGELLAETWAGLWLTLSAWISLRPAGRAKPVLLGILGALCLFTRPPLVPAWAVAVLAPLIRPSERKTVGIKPWLGGLVVGFILTAYPFLHGIHFATGAFRWLPTTGGINFYIGNSADPGRTINIRPGHAWENLTLWPELNGAHTDRDMQDFYYREAFRDIRARPAAWLKHLGVKTAQFFSSREIPRNIDLYTFRPVSSLLALTTWKIGRFGFPFAILAGLAALGLVARRGRPYRLALMILAYAAGIILIHVCDRYRLPVLPLLIVFAAAGVQALAGQLKQWIRKSDTGVSPVLPTAGDGRATLTRTPSLAFSLILIVTAAVATSLGGPYDAEQWNYKAELDRLVAVGAYDRGDFETAEFHARRAVEENPAEAHAWNQLGLLRAQKGKLDEAETYFLEALRQDPAHAPAWFNLARIAMERGQLEKARDHYLEGLAHMPGHLAARLDLGDLYLRMNRPDDAMACYEEVLRIRPGFLPALQRMERARRNPALTIGTSGH
ncbi:MAG: tetratricopeptide repeat protein [Kiritimatiellae bacterium]|nr:tetratricopeptide repeat protein [Kiritimatiellia bacterium]